jgi:TetR/AcrR family transcriptional regulator, mexJK operon transcriptional repressor
MVRPVTATRERILEAAFARFAHYGFRRTSMEDIAAEAAISRASLYSQFQNKEEIFRGLSAGLHAEALAGAEAALAGTGSLADRLQAAAEAKSLRFLEIGYGSEHGRELLDESSRLCGDLASQTGAKFRDLLARALRRASQEGEIDLVAAGLGAAEAAELLSMSMMGLKGAGVTLATYRKRLAALLKVFVAGLAAPRPSLAQSAPSKQAKRTATASPRRRAKAS